MDVCSRVPVVNVTRDIQPQCIWIQLHSVQATTDSAAGKQDSKVSSSSVTTNTCHLASLHGYFFLCGLLNDFQFPLLQQSTNYCTGISSFTLYQQLYTVFSVITCHLPILCMSDLELLTLYFHHVHFV